jgi:rhamnulose-1-phosphate aldolase/alcohol dehydrogenase
MPVNLWNDADAAGLEGLAALVYRSNLLGQDRTLVNIYGGNTSVKAVEQDHLGRAVEVLWVKGSGSDLADITERGFAGLKLDEVLPLFERAAMSDEAMVAYLDRTSFEPGRPRQSIETLLHAFVPAPHVDHTHPDAIIALACAPDGERIMAEIYGARAAWVPYIRPGFILAQQIGAAVRNNPALECVVMGKHGLVTWGETAQQCYANTLRIIGEAEDYIAARVGAEPFGPTLVPALPPEERGAILAQLLPVIRGAASAERRAILCFDDAPDVIQFVGSQDGQALAQAGAACPDHLVHTKRLPLWIDRQPGDSAETLIERTRAAIAAYAEAYQAYFEAHRGPTDKPFPAAPRVILIPGLGMVTSGPDAQGADVTRQLYHRAIAVMRGARALGGFATLSPAESFAVEYWPLELYKLSLKPAPRALHGRVALVTGAASGIGRAIARRLALDGAHVVIADLNVDGAETVAAELRQRFGLGRGLAVPCDVTSEEAVAGVFRRTALAYGGVDIVVNNAGWDELRPFVETDEAFWRRVVDVNYLGALRVTGELLPAMLAQGWGRVVSTGSDAARVGSSLESVYAGAKAGVIGFTKSLAREIATSGVTANVVCPGPTDTPLLAGMTGEGERGAKVVAALTRAVPMKRLGQPADVAAAVAFFASEEAGFVTGQTLSVSGGLTMA